MKPKTRPPLKFFVVENHQDTLDAIKMFLEAQGHTVVAAPDMKTALKLAPNTAFDILIGDIGLPEGDGWELLKRLRNKLPDVKAIAMSGYGMRAVEPKHGDLVQVKDHRQLMLGVGCWNPRSKINVRGLAPDRVEVNQSSFEQRIPEALAVREKHMHGATAFRVVNAESDFLSG